MRITNLGYNPTNQNYKSKQQNSPAFKGAINVITEDIENTPQFFDIVERVGQSIANQTHEAIRYTSRVVKKNPIFSIPAVSTLKFSSGFDSKAKQMVDNLNTEFVLINTPIEFRFIEDERLS